MGLAGKSATFMRRMWRLLHHFLVLVLAASTLSAVSVVTAPSAQATLTNADCNPIVGVGLTASGVASGSDCIVTFSGGSGTWSTPAGVTTAQVLVVGGGGAGGTSSNGAAGGGGGGQVNAQASVSISGTYTITVGAGGTPQSTLSSDATVNKGGNGGTSSVTPSSGSAITALGGSGGASVAVSAVGSPSTTGFNGGGGSTWAASVSGTNGSNGVGGYKGGSANGSGSSGDVQTGGGGGGSGGDGTNGTTSAGGNGGVGVSNSYVGTATFYGGGGGGGKRTNATGTAGSGGSGGGGAGGRQAAGSAGTANTGGGGGGAGGENVGGAGGSGVVIIRYVKSTATISSGACSSTVSDSSTASISVDGTDCVLKFTSGINSWAVPTNVAEADVLVVGGGGAGGGRSGGGGGAGGLVYLTNVTVTPSTTISVSVGAGGLNGGAGTTNDGVNGGSGSDSTFELSSSIVAKGGGGGGKNGVNGLSGGSGGGVGGTTTASETGGATTQATQNIGFGFKGSIGSSGVPSAWTGGGGGGAGAVGGVGNTNGTGGSGGAGKAISITGLSVCYAAGGGGGISQTSSNAVGAGGACSGTVVGGAGSKGTATAGNGVTNTGSGGGGSGFDGVLNGVPGDGGSGVVIVRWTIPSAAGAFPNITGMNARFNANNFNLTLNGGLGTWADTSGTGKHITGSNITGTAMTWGTSGSSANGTTKSFNVVNGTNASNVLMLSAANMTGKYTLFTVARYSGANKGRIFQGASGSGSNYLSGFHYGKNGQYFKGTWYTDQVQPTDFGVTDWVINSECSYDPDANTTVNSCSATYSANGKQRSYVTNTITSASYGIGINGLGVQTGETSDFQIADVLVFNRVLTITEANDIETYLSAKYGRSIYSDVIANYDPGDSTTTNVLLKNLGKGDGSLTENLDMTLYNNTLKSSENSGVLKFALPNGSYGQTTATMRPISRFSAAAWFKLTGAQAGSWNSILTGVGTSGNVIAPNISTYNNNVDAGFYDGGTWRTGYGSLNATSYSISNDNWYHVVTTFDGVNVRIYVNGVLRSTTASTASTLRYDTYLRIGTRFDGSSTSYGVNGAIGKVKVVDHALTDSEVLADYTADSSRYVCSSTSQTTSAGTVLTFTNPGSCSWTAPTGVTSIRALLVGGGGGGGAWVAGGGGGGGVIDNSSISVTAGTSYPIVIGGGGKGATMSAAGALYLSSNGSNTTAFGLTAYGGGGGGSWSYLGTSGATGGGGSYNNTVTSSYISQGFSGGKDAYDSAYGYPTGGGGGAGAVGVTGTVTIGISGQSGAGGAGKSSNIAGSTANYGGGGGGGCHGNGTYPCSNGAGGSGGGGAGGGSGAISASYTSRNLVLTGTSGTANTGGGGGGAGAPSTNVWSVDSLGGEGGSGTVIILIPGPAAPTITSQPTGITKTVGQSHTFSVTATISGGGTLSYQWRKNGTNISGATSSTLAFNPIAMSDSADYSVVITNTYNGSTASTTSNTAILYVETIPVSTVSTPTVSATTNTLKSISVSWTAVANADAYVVNLYRVADNVKVYFTSVFTGTSLTINADNYVGIANDTSYDVGILAIGAGNYGSATSESTRARVRTNTAYTITYNYNGATGGNGTVSADFISGGTALTLPTPSKTGSTFNGWFEASNLSGTALSSTYTPTQTRTIYAKWTVNSQTITYAGGAGASGSGPTSPISVNYGSTFTTPANTYTKNGYTFTGWSDGTNTYAAGATYPTSGTVIANVTLTATWSADSLTVTYNSQGGTAVTGTTVNTGASISSAPTAPTRTGYTFSGWSTTNSGSVISFPYAHGQTASFTLFAIWSADSLTVTYNSQSGSSVSAGSTNTGATISTAPTAPTRAGYTFTGWSTSNSGSVVSFPYTHGQTASFTLYAIWSTDTLTITFDVNGGSSIASTTTTTGAVISSAPVAPTKANYTFAGWSDTNGGTAITFPYTHGKTASFTLYAKWTANTYTLTYVYNSATGGNTTTSDSFTTGGTQITLPTPTRSGYTFGGWYEESSFTNLIGAGGATYSPTGSSLTPSAYAKWTAINYTVTYETTNSTSGLAPTDATNYNIGNTVVIKGNTGSLARTGYTFTGWTAASDGTGTLLSSGSTFTTSTSNMNFYPKWSANTYTVTYNKNGASGSPTASTSSYTTGSTAVTLTTVGTMAKTGFNFGGWSTTPTGSAHSGTFTTAVDVTLYAVWTIKSIAITFDKGIASGVTVNNFPSNTSLDYGSTLTLVGNITSTVVISSAAHVFVGWSFGGNIYRGGDTFLIGDTAPTFTAEWVKVFAVRYVMNGGTAAANSSEVDAECTYVDGSDLRCTENQVITTNAAPTRAGFTFGGWVNQGNQSVAAAATTTITSTNYLFYATWTPIDYAISYNTNQGSTAPASFTKRLGETFTVASAPTKTGYTFGGWSDGTSTLGAGATYFVSTSAVTLSAQWIANVYTVSFDWNGGSGTATSNVSYTVGNTAITLPLVGDHVKDGYSFSGWSETSNGNLISGGFTPTADTTLYAIWGTGSYTVTFNANGGTVGTSSATVPNGTSLTFPTPTRANFVFEGWYSANTGGSLLGNAGALFQPTQSRTAYARWTQSSLYGLASSALTRIGTTTASSGSNSTFTSSNSNSSVSVTVPAGSLPNGTTVNFDLVGDFTRAQTVLTGTNSYVISLVVSWLATDGTVPNTETDKPISLTIANSSIKSGMSVYAIVAGNVTLLGTASQDGTVTVNLRSDPEVVVVATKPNAPTNVTATASGIKQSAISWSAPASDGGSSITGYTATSNTGATCTTSTTSCSITGLADGTTYTFTVTATNVLGTSVASTSSSSITTASNYAVTFDAKGGSTVSNGNFFTASTVSAPTAPTRAGYTFDGWAATDGGTAITFPYAPGVTNAITLYARWTALDNAVTFDSKGGSAVTSSTFASGGSVTEPTAPTRAGYTFAGWSATDGGTSVTFPYSPGVVTAITLYAKWTQVAQSGGGSGSSSPAPSTPAPSEPLTPVKSNVTVAQPVTVIGDKDAKVTTVEISTSSTATKPPSITLDAASVKFIAEVKLVEGKLVLTPETGFSGKKTVFVTITENGSDRIIQIPLTVLPEAVTKPVLTPTASNKSIIRWTASPNADGYTVYLNGRKVCATVYLNCSVRTVLGPKSEIEIVSNGGDRTVSQKVDAEFKQNLPVSITRLVSATNTKATLTKVDIRALDKVAALIRTQGFTGIVISNISTTKKTEALATARIGAIKKYIDEKTGLKNLSYEVVPPASRTYFNNIAVKG